ncbi:hypothetical protein [Cellulomonas endophytica]|uniref:hypothetical protein n=1 Tax=Cellulomonas endophytica TaxID=2494735 RepID=UPI001013B9A1|nr:hypothetical protein [Cellulomonas endophytica]
MQVRLPLTEALDAARSSGRLPSFVVGAAPTDDGVALRVDPQGVPGLSGAVRFAASLAGPVEVVVRWVGLADGDATFAITSHARALPLHTLANMLSTTLTGILRQRGLGDLVEVRRGTEEPLLVVHVQRALDRQVPGARLVDLALAGGAAHVEVDLSGARPAGPAV